MLSSFLSEKHLPASYVIVCRVSVVIFEFKQHPTQVSCLYFIIFIFWSNVLEPAACKHSVIDTTPLYLGHTAYINRLRTDSKLIDKILIIRDD